MSAAPSVPATPGDLATPAADACRTLLVNPTVGGIGQYAHCLAHALRGAGAVPALVASAEEADELAAFPSPWSARYDVLRSYPLPLGPSLRARIRRRVLARTGPRKNNDAVAAAARAFRPDVIHAQWVLSWPHEARLWNELRRRTGAAIVYTAHDVLPHEVTPEEMRAPGPLRTAWTALYHAADHLIVHAEALKAQLSDLFGIPDSRVSVLPHGSYTFLADDNTQWPRGRARASLGLNGDEVAVLFFGFIREYKGLDTLIRAVAAMRERRAVRLLVVGKPYPWPSWEATEYAALARDLGVDKQLLPVTEYVPLADVARYFAASDIVALPYHRASQSGVLQMAYGFGRAVVCTDTGGLREAAVPGETAVFVPPRDPGAMAAALDALAADAARCEQIGLAGRRHADTAYSWKPIAARTLEIYRSVATGSGGR